MTEPIYGECAFCGPRCDVFHRLCDIDENGILQTICVCDKCYRDPYRRDKVGRLINDPMLTYSWEVRV